RRVTRSGDAAVLDLAVRVLAEVPSRRHDDEADFHRAPGRERQRIGLVRLEHRGANRQVDDSKVEAGAIRDREVDGADDIADRAASLVVEHLQDQELGPGRDTRIRAGAVVAVAGDDGGDGGAVAGTGDWPR